MNRMAHGQNSVRVHADAISERRLLLRAVQLGDLLYGWTPEEEAGPDDERTKFEVLTRRCRRAIAEVAVTPDEIRSILENSGVRTVPTSDALEDFAFECTLRAVELTAERRLREKGAARRLRPEREASNAVATLRRVLPEIIDYGSSIESDSRVSQWRALLSALNSPTLSFTSTLKSPPTWHTAARGLAGLYRLHINSKSGWSAHGPGVKFVQLALKRIGLDCSTSAIEKCLDSKRRRPNPWLTNPPYCHFPKIF
jgi:hypothetical protein